MSDPVTQKNIYPLFATGVYKNKLNITLTNNELAAIYDLNSAKQILGTKLSNDKFILEQPELHRLKNILLGEIKEYFNSVMGYEFDIYITNSWCNVAGYNEGQTLHNHANSIVSGIFYLNVNDSQPSITFVNPTPPFLLNMRSQQYNMFNSLEFDIPIEDNTVILFPSQCFHYVKSNPTNNDRISIAFNTFVKGKIGVETSGGDLDLS
jgi:uncharacterized protein (TIGR02466 family)